MKRLSIILLVLFTTCAPFFSETLYAGDKLRAFSVSEDLHKNTIYLSSVKPSVLKDYYEINFYVIVTPAGSDTLEGTHTYPVTFVAKQGDTILLKNNVWSYSESIRIDQIENNSVTFSKIENSKKNTDISAITENLDWNEETFEIKNVSSKTGKVISTKVQLGFLRNDKVSAKLIKDKSSALEKELIQIIANADEDSLKIENRNDFKIKIKNELNENVLYSQRIIGVHLTDFVIEDKNDE